MASFRAKVRKHNRQKISEERKRIWMDGSRLEINEEMYGQDHRFSISSESTASDTEEYSMRKSALSIVASIPRPQTPVRLNNCAIWNEQQLKGSLESLLCAKSEKLVHLSSLETERHEDWAAISIPCYDACVLFACLKSNVEMLDYFLKMGANPQCTDSDGRTPLHYAASSQSLSAKDCILLLHECGADVNVWDKHGIATPLLCAAALGNINSIYALLQCGADINAGLSDSRYPDACGALIWAVRAKNASCVRLLIAKGAAVNSSQAYSEAPIHVAASQGDDLLLSVLLEAKADVRVVMGANRMNALHLAAEEGNTECLELLLQAKADFNAVNIKQQTPLHLAALSQSVECVATLVKYGANVEARDKDHRTPLHSAVVKSSRSTDIVRHLVAAGADVNAQDSFGYSALHLAALNENSEVASVLIAAGADLSAKTNGGATALTFLVRKSPDVVAALPLRLDSAVMVTEHDALDADCEIYLDFRVLIPPSSKGGESAIFTTFIAAGQRHLLQHPISRTFLFLKWGKIRSLFLIYLLLQAIFTMFLSASIMLLYHQGNCTDKMNNSVESAKNSSSGPFDTRHPNHVAFVIVLSFAILFCMFFSITEIYQILQSPKDYVTNWENWVQIIIIVGFIILVVPIPDDTWKYHAAAVLTITAWGKLMMIVGLFPTFGLYVLMFATVTINISKFMAAYLCPIIGFSLALALLFPKTCFLTVMPDSLLSILVMMTGELEYRDYFFDKDQELQYPGTTHIIFLFFLLLMVVVMMNLLVGLAVSDIQGLQKSAGMTRLVRQAELIARMESNVYSSVFNCLPSSTKTWIQRHILLLPSFYNHVFSIRPNDPRDDRLPPELKEGIVKILLSRRRRQNRRGGKNLDVHRINSVFEDDQMFELYQQLNEQFCQLANISNGLEKRMSCIERKWNIIHKEIHGVRELFEETIQNKVPIITTNGGSANSEEV